MVLEDAEVVFFDVGGTLSWAEPSADVIWARALEEHGHRVPPAEVVRRTGVPGPEVNRPDLIRALQATNESFRALPFPRDLEEQEVYFRQVDAAVLERLGLPAEKEVLDSVTRRFAEDMVSHVYEDTVPALQRLQESGFRLGVISNATHDLPEGLAKLGLASYFETVTYSYQVGVEKPAPGIFATALDQMGLGPERTVHVGDTYDADILGARGVGITPVLIARQGPARERDCVTVSTLTDLLKTSSPAKRS